MNKAPLMDTAKINVLPDYPETLKDRKIALFTAQRDSDHEYYSKLIEEKDKERKDYEDWVNEALDWREFELSKAEKRNLNTVLRGKMNLIEEYINIFCNKHDDIDTRESYKEEFLTGVLPIFAEWIKQVELPKTFEEGLREQMGSLYFDHDIQIQKDYGSKVIRTILSELEKMK